MGDAPSESEKKMTDGAIETVSMEVIKLPRGQQTASLLFLGGGRSGGAACVWRDGIYFPSWWFLFVSRVFNHFTPGSTHNYYAVFGVLSGEI